MARVKLALGIALMFRDRKYALQHSEGFMHGKPLSLFCIEPGELAEFCFLT